MPLLAKKYSNLSKLLTFLCNLPLKEDTMISINNFNDDITLSLTATINKYRPILPEFHHDDTSNYLHHLLVPSVGENFHKKARQTYIIMSQSLTKDTPNSIIRPDTPLAYTNP